MGPGDTGDCEDFALTKMQDLINSGFNVKNLQMAWGQTEKGGYHAFMVIQTSNRGTLVLDNRYPNVMKLENVPYRIFGYQKAGQTWAKFTTQLTDVPIEYMTCNSMAFADGDEVIVKFEDQDWNQPKVIGFHYVPGTCELSIYQIGGLFTLGNGSIDELPPPDERPSGTQIYDPIDDDWLSVAEMPGTVTPIAVEYPMTIRACLGSTTDVSNIWVIGGLIREYYYVFQLLPEYPIKRCDKYNKGLNIWTERQEFPGVPRSFVQGWYLSGSTYIIGGSDYETTEAGEPVIYHDSHNDFDKFNDETDSWISLANYYTSLYLHTTFKLGGNGYIAGGSSGNWGDIYTDYDFSSVTAVTRKYDPDSSTWSFVQNLDEPKILAAGFNLSSTGKGYVAGGEYATGPPGPESSFYRKNLLEYDPDLDTYQNKTPLANWFSRLNAASAGQYGYLNLNSGDDDNKRFQQYDGLADTWTGKQNSSYGIAWYSALSA